jgi:hypothetical protein
MTDVWMNADRAYQDKLDASEGRMNKLRASKKLRKSKNRSSADNGDNNTDHARQRVMDAENQEDNDDASLGAVDVRQMEGSRKQDDMDASRARLKEFVHSSARMVLSSSHIRHDVESGNETPAGETESDEFAAETDEIEEAPNNQNEETNETEEPKTGFETPQPQSAPGSFVDDCPVQDPKPRPRGRSRAIPTETSIYYYLTAFTFWLVCVTALLIVVLYITLE